MAFSVNSQNQISLTRGDTLNIQISIMDGDTPYVPDPSDVIRFALKHARLNPQGSDYADTSPILTEIIPNDTLILSLDPEDTESLGFGDYVYDLEITMADGTVDTFVTSRLFRITPEVH